MSTLQIGNSTATTTRVFQCGECKRSYSRVDHLARHVRSHTQEKPYQCTVCSKRFARRDLLKRHAAGHENRPNETSPPKHSREQGSRVGRACKTCADMHLKCDERKPCTRCRKKNIPCNPLLDPSFRFSSSPPLSPGADIEAAEDLLRLAENPTGFTTTPNPAIIEQVDGVITSEPQASINESSDSQLLFGISEEHSNNEPPTANMPEYLRNVFPNLADPYMGSIASATVPGIWMTNFDLDANMDFTDMDLSFLDTYNYQVPFELGSQHLENSPVDFASSLQSPASHRSTAIGAEAFQKNPVWRFRPSNTDTGNLEEQNLSLPANENRRRMPQIDQRTTHEKLDDASRDRILALILSACKSETWDLPRWVTTFPSLDLLDALLQYCLSSSYSPAHTFLHTPTISPRRMRTELAVALVAAGAMLTPDASLMKLALTLQEVLRQYIPKRWESDNSLTRDLELQQAYTIMLGIALWSGSSRKLELAESFLQPLVTMIRREGRFRRSYYPPVVVQSDDKGEALEQKWQSWIRLESIKRLVYHVLNHDALSSIVLLTVPMVSYAEVVLPLPDAHDLWIAPDANRWKTLYLAKINVSNTRRPSMTDILFDVDLLGSSHQLIDERLALNSFLSGAWGLVWEYRQLNSVVKSRPRQSSQNLIMASRFEDLMRMLQDLRFNTQFVLSGSQYIALRLELILMHLHMSFEDVQFFAGIEGWEEARRVYPSLREWVKTSAARQAVCHAGQIIRISEALPKMTIRGFVAVAVYQASLALWVYGLIAENTGSSQGLNNLIADPTRNLPVWLDEPENSEVQRFIRLERGTPFIRGLRNSGMPAAMLHDPSSVMDIILHVIRSNFNSGGSKPALVENLIQLMTGLRTAAARVPNG